ncbi:MAG: hypothetical protein HY740_02640 [Chloroflexi bacterium]|nr:hypothetical protein [Chloroflexota bacterium]
MKRIIFPILFSLACSITTNLPDPTAAPQITVAPTSVAQTPGAASPTQVAQPTRPSLPHGSSQPPLTRSTLQGSSQPPLAGTQQPPLAATLTNGTNYSVTNPTSGVKLFVRVYSPVRSALSPVLVLVPGGKGDSNDFRNDPNDLTGAGFVVVTFDPDGRGQSAGTEDNNGSIHQDGLAAVIRFAATLVNVDKNKIGVATYSYGITMGSGVLARYPDLPVKFLIDWEGPANRNDTGGCTTPKSGHLQGVYACTDEAAWSQREAVSFIGKLKIPYQRIQSEKDHAQPDAHHAVTMINAALAAGGVPLIKLNDTKITQKIDLKSLPPLISESQERLRGQLVAKYAQELLK